MGQVLNLEPAVVALWEGDQWVEAQDNHIIHQLPRTTPATVFKVWGAMQVVPQIKTRHIQESWERPLVE